MVTGTTADLAAGLGRPLAGQAGTDLAGVLLDDAETIIRTRAGESRTALPVHALVQVEANSVVRVLRNPSGHRSEQDNGYGPTEAMNLLIGNDQDSRARVREPRQLSALAAPAPGVDWPTYLTTPLSCRLPRLAA